MNSNLTSDFQVAGLLSPYLLLLFVRDVVQLSEDVISLAPLYHRSDLILRCPAGVVPRGGQCGFQLAVLKYMGVENPTRLITLLPYSLKHVVGSCLVGSTGGHEYRELSAVVRMYPDNTARAIIANCAKNL